MRQIYSADGGRRRPAGKAGFTLVEVVVVLVIIGVLMLIAIRSPFNSNSDLIAETDQLRGHLRFAQSQAIANNTDSWGILLNANGYALRKNGANAPINLPGLDAATYTFVSGVSATLGTGSITFDEFGSPGNATLSITLSDGTHSSSISLSAQTGYQS